MDEDTKKPDVATDPAAGATPGGPEKPDLGAEDGVPDILRDLAFEAGIESGGSAA